MSFLKGVTVWVECFSTLEHIIQDICFLPTVNSMAVTHKHSTVSMQTNTAVTTAPGASPPPHPLSWSSENLLPYFTSSKCESIVWERQDTNHKTEHL